MRHAQFPEEPGDGTASFALLEAKTAQLTPNPFVQTQQSSPTCRITVVVDPSTLERIEFGDHLRKAHAPIPTGDLADFLLGAFDALGSDPKLTVQEEPMAEELAFPYRSDGALFAVDAQPEFPFQELCNR